MKTVTLTQLQALAARAPERAPTSSGSIATPAAKLADIEVRARAYLKTIPPAVAGQRGHDRTFYAANRLVRGFDLSPDQALPLLAEWNATCDPPWSERDLMRKIEGAAAAKGPRGFLLGAGTHSPAVDASGRTFTRFRNFTWEEIPDGERMKQVKVGRPLEAIADELYGWTFGFPKRCGGELFAVDEKHQPVFLRTDTALFAWLGSKLAARCDGADPIQWDGRAGVSKGEFRAYLEQTAESYDAIELYPHEPPLPGHYYVHPDLPESDGSSLNEFVRLFYPARSEDEDLIRAFVATLFWGGPTGQSPLFVLLPEPDDPEAGRGVAKTSVAQHVMSIVGGSITLRSSEKFGDFVKRLVNDPGNHRCILLDNMKCDGKFGWSDLESLLTAASVSGSKHYIGEGQRPNHFTFAMTTNETDFTDDIAKRAIPIWLTRFAHQDGWERKIRTFIESNRWKIAADCIGLLRGERHESLKRIRWTSWQEEVLSRITGHDAILADVVRVVLERQEEMNAGKDERQEARELVRDEIRAAVRERFVGGDNPECYAVRITSKKMAELYAAATGSKRSPKGATREIKKLGIVGLNYVHSGDFRGWHWTGNKTGPATEIQDLEQ
jgi:hypothetical protein